jgi:hypothetical protein
MAGALETPIMDLRKGLASNSTAAYYTVPVPTGTAPATGDDNVVFAMRDYGRANHLHVIPYGTDANNETLDLAIYGWEFVPGGSGTADDLYVPTFLGEWGGTMSSTLNGVSGGVLSDTEYFCDTLTETAVPYSLTEIIGGLSTADAYICRVIVDTIGFRWLDVRGDRGGSAASWNFLWRVM